MDHVAFASPTCRRMSQWAVGGEVLEGRLELRGDLVERVEIVPRCALGGAHTTASSTARRRSQISRHCASICADGGSAGGWGSATNVPPPRPRVANTVAALASAVSAWRSVERAIPRRAHSSRSAGSRIGARRPELDRRCRAGRRSPRRRSVSAPARTPRRERSACRARLSDRQWRPPSCQRLTCSHSLEPGKPLPSR